MSGHKDTWRIECGRDKYTTVRENEEFIAVMRLARLINALRCEVVTFAESKNDGTPAYARLKTNTLFFVAAIAWEAVDTTRKNRALKQLTSYKRVTTLLKKGGRYRRIESFLDNTRNQIAFHVDDEAMRVGLSRYEKESYIVAEGHGPSVRNAYYSMADNVYLHYLFGADDKKSFSDDEIREIVEGIMNFAGEFALAADDMIGEALKEMGWELK